MATPKTGGHLSIGTPLTLVATHVGKSLVELIQ